MTVPGNLSSPLLATAADAAAATTNITKSLRFNSDDSAYLNRTPSSAGNRKKWTWAGWIKRTELGRVQNIFRVVGALSDTTVFQIRFMANDAIGVVNYSYFPLISDAVFRDVSAWLHLVVALDVDQASNSNKLRFYINGSEITSWATDNRGSLGTNAQGVNQASVAHTIGGPGSSEYFSGYLADIYFIDGSALSPTSFGAFDSDGVWQAATYSGTFGTNGFHLLDFASESTIGHDSSGNENDFTENNLTAVNTFSTNMSPSSTAYDDTTLSNGGLTWSGNVANDTGTVSSLAIPTNKKTYVEVTHTSTGGGNPGPGVANGPTVEMGLDNVKAWWRGGTDGSVAASTLGSFTGTNTSWSNGDVLGIALDNTANSGAGSITFYKNGTQVHTGGSGWTSYTDLRFEWQNNGTGTSSGTWNYGASSFSYPVSGHTGLFESTSLGNVLFDVPTNGDQSDTGAGGEVSGNYAVLQSNFGTVAGAVLSPSNGNLTVTSPSGDSNFCPVSIPVSSGKWYVEVTAAGSGTASTCGVWKSPIDHTTNYYQNPNYRYWQNDGNIYDGNGGNSAIYNVTWAAGDVVGIALDMDNGKVFFSKNGTFLGTSNPVTGANPAASGLTGSWVFALQSGSGTNHTLHINTGQRSYSNSAPTGYKALCTTNLPTPTIAQGKDYFNAVLYTGTGSNPRAVTGVGHSSDFVWIKARNAAAGHAIMDSVRGTGTNALASHTNGAEGSETYGQMSSFDSDGFTVTFSQNGEQNVNFNNRTYVAWSWDAGSSTVSNTDGSITSSVRANTTAGFSIVTATQGSGTSTWGHGLNTKPDLIIMKARGQAFNWYVSHSALDNQSTKFLRLNLTDGVATNANWFNSTEPTNSVVSTKAGGMWTQGDDFVAYCFSAVPGYSAFGSYTGNGNSSSGTFVFCGFRPRWVLIKATSISGQSWYILDAARDPHNLTANKLEANSANAENASPNTATTNSLDLLSNGFKLRTSNDGTNQSNATYIYYAVAENPFQANGGLAR